MVPLVIACSCIRDAMTIPSEGATDVPTNLAFLEWRSQIGVVGAHVMGDPTATVEIDTNNVPPRVVGTSRRRGSRPATLPISSRRRRR